MQYIHKINELLRPSITGSPVVLDLFAGCGGLALGFEAQGFKTIGYEMDSDCCLTYRHNLKGDCINIQLTTDYFFPKAQVVIGGPPCQPFSVLGNQKGDMDLRDGFPVFISAVEQANPDIWMFENVRGLMYKNKWYLEKIIERLSNLGYIVECHLLNAVNYGVPQNRERVIVVGHRGKFALPAVHHKKITAGEAIGDLMHLTPSGSKFLTPSMDAYVKKYEIASKCVNPRDLYPDRPSRTVTCRNLAGDTSDMMRIRLSDGRRRKLIIREAARLQSFPDWFEFQGDDKSAFKQIGNAVAPMFSYHLAQSVREYLNSAKRFNAAEVNYHMQPKQLSIPLEIYAA